MPSKILTLKDFTDDEVKALRQELVSKSEGDAESGCLLWTKHTVKGYGRLRVRKQSLLVHRIAFALYRDSNLSLTGEGMDSILDHLCRTRNCINPDHLEKVSNRENTVRGKTVRNKCPVGVSHKGLEVYRADIRLKGSTSSSHLGLFASPEVASCAYQTALAGILAGNVRTKEDIKRIRLLFKPARYVAPRKNCGLTTQ